MGFAKSLFLYEKLSDFVPSNRREAEKQNAMEEESGLYKKR